MNRHRRAVPARTARRLVGNRYEREGVNRPRIARATDRRAAIREQLA